MSELESCPHEDAFEEFGYDEEAEAEEVCPAGHAVDECDGEGCAGIETCEFLCPWRKVDSWYKRQTRSKESC